MMCMNYHVYLGDHSRESPIPRQRFDWHSFVTVHQQTADWVNHLRMRQESFDKLLLFIRHDLIVDEAQAARRGGAIIPELQLYCAIRYLAGGLYSDIFYFCGISRSAFHASIWKVIVAINKCPQLQIRFPSTNEECSAAAAGFKAVSTGHAINNCVCVLDGYHMEIICPPKHVVKNVKSYFNGHYRSHGFNVQAACDPHCRYVFFGVASPGVTPDRDAISQCELHKLVEGLQKFGSNVPVDNSIESDNVPIGFYCAIGDCAYPSSDTLVPIFGGAQARPEDNDNFNYFASQLRIRIEMAFGMMVEKFGILQSALQVDVEHVRFLALCIAQLHNFCINERLGEAVEAAEFVHEGNMHQRDASANVQHRQITLQEYVRSSQCRDYMVRRVKSKGLVRPLG